MTAAPVRITDDELAREVEALKSHRRLSVNRPVLDPDLPDLAAAYGGGQELLSVPSPERERRGYSLVDDGAVPTRSPSSSSTSPISPGKSFSKERARFTARRRGQGSDQSSGSEGLTASPTRLSPVSGSPTNDAFDSRGLVTSPTSMSSSSSHSQSQSPKDPSHLFWVPASVHPEISPTDFRNFIKEHAARAVNQHTGQDVHVTNDTLPPLAVGDSPIAQRLNSVRQQQQERRSQQSGDARGTLIGRATSLSRRGSTLRRQYRPENDIDDGEEDKVPRPLQRNRSGLIRGTYGLAIPNLTIDDLQRLEAAAEEASQTQDPAMLRSVLRRTLSLNTTPDMDTMDAVPSEPIEDPDAPIIVPKPGQILRRAARTKMRKASGDASRGSLASRRRAPRSSTDADAVAVSEGSRAWELQKSDAEDMERPHSGQSELSSGADDDSSAGDSSSRPLSTEATDSIVDAYSRDSYQSDASQRTSVTSIVDAKTYDANVSGGSGGRVEVESPSPPHTPTQDSFTTLAAPLPAIDGADWKTGPIQPPLQSTESPETPRSDSKVNNNQIKPIAVSHLPPTPAFEKTRPQQQQQQQQQQKVSTRPASASSQGSYTAEPAPLPVAQSQQAPRRDAQPVPSAKSQVAPMVTGPPQQQQHQPPRPPLQQQQLQQQQPVQPPSTPPATSHAHAHTKHKEKERKGAFGLSWFGLGKDDEEERAKLEEKSQRKREKHEKRERKEREREEREKEEQHSSSSFLGALFGKKKGHDESHHQQSPAGPRPSMNGQLTAGSLLERNEMCGKGGYFYSRYPIHIERAVYRLSHIKLANPRRPLYEQVLISNLMFWYLSVINRGGQQYGQQQQTAGQVVQGQGAEQNGVEAGQGANGYVGQVDTSSAYDGMDTLSNGSPESEDGSSSSDQYSSASAGGGGGNGAALRQKRNGLVKPNRAPGGANRGRTAETPMKQPGYGMQHRQIDDDLKMHGGAGSTGFVVGQVVDVKALQANTPYMLVPDPRAGSDDGNMSTTTDYLGLGNQFGLSEPLWPSSGAEGGEQGGEQQRSTSAQQNAISTVAGEQKRSSSPNRPYRSEAEKERAWLKMLNSSSNTASSNRTSSPGHGYGSISQDEPLRADGEREKMESQPQGRSMSLGGIGAMNHTGDWGSSNPTTDPDASNSNTSGGRGDRNRKMSMGNMAPSASSQGLVNSTSSGSFGSVEGGMTSSVSAGALDGKTGGVGEGQIHLPIAPGSSAMLDAARLSQSRRR
ncbi:uncharacterized protein UHOD_04294 [Ustilago sp. UG-2017b]|nr:uncharacterized protein UHOD_04294 [Ustilago sp. UG-2017b]